MKVFVRRFRGPLLGFATLIFLAYAVWGGHPPGEPPSMRDFLFIMALFAGPFLVFAYAFWSVSGWTGVPGARGDSESRRLRIALTGAVLGGSSAALLLLMAAFWDSLVMHEGLAKVWVGTGVLTAAAATVCGIGGTSKLRVPAIVSVMLLPFWLFAAGLLVKAVMDQGEASGRRGLSLFTDSCSVAELKSDNPCYHQSASGLPKSHFDHPLKQRYHSPQPLPNHRQHCAARCLMEYE